MRQLFDLSQHGREAARKMLHVCQVYRSDSDYAIQLHALVATTDWISQALSDVFIYGLCEEIKDELVTCELPPQFDKLLDLTIHIDSLIHQCRDEQTSTKSWRRQRNYVSLLLALYYKLSS